MAPSSRCPKCDLYLSPIRPHACLVDRINEALEGVDTSSIDRHERMVRWLAGWEPELVATAAELSDELERTRTRLAAVTAAGDALAHLVRHLAHPVDPKAMAALLEWRAATTT